MRHWRVAIRSLLRSIATGTRVLLFASPIAALSPNLGADSAALSASAPEVTGIVLEEALSEISGLAVSRRYRNLLYAVNDSGNPAAIHALSPSGNLRGSFVVSNARNIDWEDLASFSFEGRDYLLVADIGDNGGLRATLDLWLLEEPSSLSQKTLVPQSHLVFRWPDGARDCEAMAVDVEHGEILLLSKRRVPAQLFRLPLSALFDRGASGRIAVAEEIARLQHLPQPSPGELEREPKMGRFRAQITAIDLRDDGALAVQTYRDTYLYRRGAGETWRTALAREPVALGATFLPQAEAVAFDPRSDVAYVASERVPSPIVRLHVPRQPAARPSAKTPARKPR